MNAKKATSQTRSREVDSADLGAPSKYVPVESQSERDTLLSRAIESQSLVVLWTKEKELHLQTHFSDAANWRKGILLLRPFTIPEKEWLQLFKDHEDKTLFFLVFPKNRAVLGFESRLLEVEVSTIKIAPPEKLFKIQRRKHFRWQIPKAYELSVNFKNELFSSLRIRKTIFDLSAGGFSFIVSDQEATRYRVGTPLTKAEIMIRHKQVLFQAEVKNHMPAPPGSPPRSIKIGIEFKKIAPADYDYLQLYIAEYYIQYSQ